MAEEDGEVFNEGDINNYLSYRMILPAKCRVAILNLSPKKSWSYYSSDFVYLDKEMVKGFVAQLNDSPRIYDASFLPSMLVPKKKTIDGLRAAAARYQADLLLTYRSECEDFQKYNILNPNQNKAYCTVEAVVIDTRSGIIPFTAIATNEFTAEKSEQDFNFTETRKKAEMKALGTGLGEISTQLRMFVEGLPLL